MLPPGFIKGRSVHITFDNSDGRQQTLTGAHTTHHTTGTIFQARYPSDATTNTKPKPELPDITDHEKLDYGSFKIPKKRIPPPSFQDFNDNYKDSRILDEEMKRNIAWVIVGAVGDDCLDECLPDVDKDELGPVGSWTTFMKGVTSCETTKCKLEYLPVVPLPPDDNVVKWYMDMIMEIATDLELGHIFAHADEAINCKMLIISWIRQGKYDKIIPLIGGFHTILVKLKILFKKYGCLGFSDWWVDAGAIAEGSVAQAIEGRHYYRSVRLHKQTFEALLRYRMKSSNINFDHSSKEAIANLRQHPIPGNLKSLVNLTIFDEICCSLTKAEGTQANIVVEYLKDVSAMLALISAVREKCIERHLAAERALLPQCFAFGHVNYARYLTFQHVNLQDMKQNNKPVWEDLSDNGFGGSLTGEPFSTIHGDLITETTINREVKVRGGPMQGGYSTTESTTDNFIKTRHIMAKIRATLKERLNVLSSSVHKETTIGARKQHESMVRKLVLQLDQYFNPFLNGAARHMKTGMEIDHDVIQGLLSSTEVGEQKYTEFVDMRLKATGENRINFFDKITKPKIKTGMEKTKKDPKAVNILKEDRQAFGLLVGKATSPEEAHSYPLTSVPLALATPERDLRQGTKAALRNYLMEESAAVGDKPPRNGNWLVDGMAAVKSVPAQSTWGEYAAALLKFCLPPSNLEPRHLGIIFDAYSTSTTKELTQLRRGKPGRRIHITSSSQTMPKGKDWESFLRNADNKTELIRFLVGYYKDDAVRSKLPVPLTVTEEEETWLITPLKIEKQASCNHHEADTRLILHACKSDDPVIVRATDTDIFVLLAYAFSAINPSEDWVMKIDHERYVSVKAIHARFGQEVCKVLPAYHSITGCDTTSFPFGVGKVKPMKKMEKLGKCHLLSNLGTSPTSVQNIAKAKQFLRTCMYAGAENEDFVRTRIRMYDKQKVKSSSNLLPDESSSEEHVKRSDLQACIWYQCLRQDIAYPSIEGRGWKETGDGFRPVWFTCPQFPPSLSLSSSKTRCKPGDYYDADEEGTSSSGQPPKKRRKGSNHSKGKGSEYSGEDELSESDTDIVQDQTSASSDSRDEVHSSESQTDTDLNISE